MSIRRNGIEMSLDDFAQTLFGEEEKAPTEMEDVKMAELDNATDKIKIPHSVSREDAYQMSLDEIVKKQNIQFKKQKKNNFLPREHNNFNHTCTEPTEFTLPKIEKTGQPILISSEILKLARSFELHSDLESSVQGLNLHQKKHTPMYNYEVQKNLAILQGKQNLTENNGILSFDGIGLQIEIPKFAISTGKTLNKRFV